MSTVEGRGVEVAAAPKEDLSYGGGVRGQKRGVEKKREKKKKAEGEGERGKEEREGRRERAWACAKRH